jgi:tRNA (mo5U34)-methyltransferase
MQRVVIWGTGGYAEHILTHFPHGSLELTAFVDNDPTRHGTFHDRPVVGPEALAGLDFDSLAVASIFYAQIREQALGLGVPGEKLAPASALAFYGQRGRLTPEAYACLCSVPWWYHAYEILPGVATPGICRYKPELLDHPEVRDLTGLRALDIGAWDGPYTLELARREAAVTAFDIQPAAHSGFDAMRRVNGLDVPHICANVYHLNPAEHGIFDLVTFFGVYYHLKNPLAALANINAVLPVGGLLLVEGAVLEGAPLADAAWAGRKALVAGMADIPLACYVKGTYEGDWSNWWVPNLACLRDWVESSGFEIIRSGTIEDSRRGVLAARKVRDLPREHVVLPPAR